jgi:hypothetical protein
MRRPSPAFVHLGSASGLRALACLLVLTCTGCSFRILRPAPPRSDWPEPVLPSSSEERCTNSLLPVVADATAGTIMASVGYIERNSGAPEVAFTVGALAIPFLISSLYGAVTVTRCRAYKAHFIDAATGGHI